MKKLVLAMCVLITTLYSCSESENGNKLPEGYVDVTIGVESESLESGPARSIVHPNGYTKWRKEDAVIILDGENPVEFQYASENEMHSAAFKGRLKSEQGKQTYYAYHSAKKAPLQLLDNMILKAVRGGDIVVNEGGIGNNSKWFGDYCSMIATPAEFDACNADDRKKFEFHQLATMIVANVHLRPNNDTDLRSVMFNNVVFTVETTDGEKVFNETIKVDLKKPLGSLEELDNCIIYDASENEKTSSMSTTMQYAHVRTVGDLVDEYDDVHGSFPIPIFTLPVVGEFCYIATVSFNLDNVPQLQFQSLGKGKGLTPAGLNKLDFDYKHAEIIAN
ncbi:hypothetical protein [Bacteroides sp. 519]|uniref:hypothetical protein n=1 Tax=Bacteroides sp. 519 TaxID=2302937 RepID=UPI0013D61643|nr:hypothetical protein [Bacteroides sp. 519]NDV60221.1 hypothetical protein [Bacteroides sp. 519]